MGAISILTEKNYIFNKIKSINKCLKNDFKIINPKILISGINPHAGEKGKIGNDENKILIPEINKIKKQIRLDFICKIKIN